jgi:hypothetical protein
MKPIIFVLFLLAPVVFYGQKAQPHNYMSMVLAGDNFIMSVDSKSYKKFDVSKEKLVSGMKGLTDLTPLLRRIEEYEEIGWELFHFGTIGTTGTLVIMRKAKL